MIPSLYSKEIAYVPPSLDTIGHIHNISHQTGNKSWSTLSFNHGDFLLDPLDFRENVSISSRKLQELYDIHFGIIVHFMCFRIQFWLSFFWIKLVFPDHRINLKPVFIKSRFYENYFIKRDSRTGHHEKWYEHAPNSKFLKLTIKKMISFSWSMRSFVIARLFDIYNYELRESNRRVPR